MSPSSRYRLDVSIRIQEIDPQYGPMGGNALEVREQADLTLNSFMEVAQVLGHFHELTESFRESADGG